MALKEWNELPFLVKMSRRKMYEYLKEEVGNSSSTNSNQNEGEGEGGETGG